MSSLVNDEDFGTIPRGSTLGIRVSNFNTDQISCTDLTVGGTFSMKNIYEINTGTATTTGIETVTLYISATESNAIYMYNVRATAVTSLGVASIFKKTIRVKNIAGVLELGTEFDIWYDSDPAVSTTSITFEISGQNILVRAVGAAATQLQWSAIIEEIKINY